MSDALRAFAVTIVETLRAKGHQALFAGGCVRDMLLGREPSDFDVATDATPEVVMSLFRRTLPVGMSFGVVRVLGPRSTGEVEVATFRSDGEYLDGRRPESVTFGNAHDDAQRRDFTINGMFFDPLRGEVIDYVGGREDLDRRQIRAIGNPRERFAEDKLRLLRAIRFGARLGFEIEAGTWDAIVAMASDVIQVSVERIVQEWRKIIIDPSRTRSIKLARDAGIAAAILPEIKGLADESTPPVHPTGVTNWSAIVRTLDALGDEPTFALAMAAMLPREGLTSDDVDGLARRWKLSTAERERMLWLHAHRTALSQPQSLPRSRLKRLLSEPGIDELLRLQRADGIATTGDLSQVTYCEQYLRNQPEGPIDPPPLLTGRDLIDAGMRPGPAFSAILESVRNAQLDGLIATKDEAIALAVQGRHA